MCHHNRREIPKTLGFASELCRVYGKINVGSAKGDKMRRATHMVDSSDCLSSFFFRDSPCRSMRHYLGTKCPTVSCRRQCCYHFHPADDAKTPQLIWTQTFRGALAIFQITYNELCVCAFRFVACRDRRAQSSLIITGWVYPSPPRRLALVAGVLLQAVSLSSLWLGTVASEGFELAWFRQRSGRMKIWDSVWVSSLTPNNTTANKKWTI